MLIKDLDEKIPLNCRTLNNFVKNGSINEIYFLIKLNCPSDEYTSSIASYRGDLEIMKLLYDYGCIFNEYTFEVASHVGHIENIKWLFNINCPWGVDVFNTAVYNGNFKIMEFLYKNNCPRDDYIIHYSPTIECTKWLEKLKPYESEGSVVFE